MERGHGHVIIPPGVYSKPGVYYPLAVHPRRLNEAGVYLMPAFIRGNTVHNLSVVVCGHFVGNCVHVCVLTQLVAIASKCTNLDVCAFHNYHVMTELWCIELSMYMHLLICIALSQLMQGFVGGGETALHAASVHGHVHVATLLLQHGAEVDSRDEVRLLYVSMVNMVCQKMVCSV